MQIHPIPKPAPGAEPELPKEALCYAAGATGLFKVIRNPFYSACVPAGEVAGLADLKEGAQLHVPKLPLDLFRRIESFFVAIFAKYGSEAVVLLYCDPEKRRWEALAPPQVVRGLHVEYSLADLPEPPAGYQLFGTVHSHAHVNAFHSGTDDEDEAHFDGLHITVGHVDQPQRSYACRWMIAGKAFKSQLNEVVQLDPLPPADPKWLAQVAQAPEEPRSRPRQEPVESGWGPPSLWEEAAPEDFETREEYVLYLESLREDLDARIYEAERFEPQPGERHAATR
ncbi:MAG: Mov34/MPN/PAD-1 family protein [Planctomycetes bacterium]|nr:Mov34/MPN/PAD-1 family protein [Planctomycetota bacterium]